MSRVSRIFSPLLLAALLLAACSSTAPPAAPPAVSAPATAVAAPSTAPAATSMVAPALATASPTARPVDPNATTSEHLEFTSNALASNLLGDSATRTIHVLLPPGYATSDASYPVVYVLHYFTGNAGTHFWDFKSAFEKARKAGEVRDMIMVFPDASNKLYGSWYLDSPTTGGYETYVARELVNYIDGKFRTIPDSESRGVTGCSMGGDGSLHLALKHPDVFKAAAVVSAQYNWVQADTPEWAAKQVWKMPEALADFPALPFGPQVYLSRAAVAAPNPNNPPFYMDMPFTMSGGVAQPVDAVWEKIASLDPVHDLGRYAKPGRALPYIMLYHGDADDLTDVRLAREYDKLLTDAGVKHEYLEVKNGGHCGLEYGPVLKFMSDHLAFSGAPASSAAAEAEGKTAPTKRVLLIVPEQSMDMELMLTKEVSVMMSELEKGGYEVVVTSASGQPLAGGATTIKPDMKLADVKAGDYTGLILPCLAVPDGHQPPTEELEIIKTVLSQGKPVAAQNGGVWALGLAGGLKGRQFAFLEDPGASFEAGAYKGDGVVQDGNIITSGSCPFMAQMTGRADGTTELTQKLISSLDASKQ